MGKIKSLAGDTILYGLGSIVPRSISFLLVTLHTGVFQPEEYGVITKLFAYTAVVNTIFLFGMETAYFRYATKEFSNETKIYNLAQTVVFGVSFFLAAIIIIFSNSVAEWIKIPGKSNYVVWLAIIMFLDAFVAIPFARLRLQKKALLFAVGKLVNIGLLVGLNIFLLVDIVIDSARTLGLGFAFKAGADIGLVLIANLVANIFYIFFFYKSILVWRPTIDPEISRSMIRYGYPIMITGLAGMTNEMFSRVTLDEWLPPGFYEGRSSDYALGVFGACYKLSMLMTLAVTAFRYAAEPFFFSNAADKNSPALFARINHYFILVCCLLLVFVSINLDIFKYFLADPEYWTGLHIVPILLLANLFLGVYYNFSVWFKLTDRTYWGTIIAIGGAVITVVANYLLIPRFGYEGSSWATLICYISMTVWSYYLGQKYYPIPYKILKSLGYIFASIALVYLVNMVSIDNTWVASGFHAVVILVFAGVILILEKKEFRQSVN